MCGFVSLVDTTLSTNDLADLGGRMLVSMSHRGPDYRGTWSSGPVFLGHNRLSIIDLSSASHQPMTKGTATLTYNGEVYNYRELRTELERDGYSFTTTGDTEVILAAYDRWGDRCVEHFIGMWAFAIWDEQRQRLFCSRDRFGIKPFHYAHRLGRLHIASEIKAVRHSPLVSGGINEAQLLRGLYLGWMHHHEETVEADVWALPASHNLIWENGNISVVRYADIPTHDETNVSFDESVTTFRELFFDSVQLCARRDVPMGVCLSGGLDSTSIACTLASMTDEHDVLTFTAYYEGNGNVDERPWIYKVLERYPKITPQYISPTDNDVADAIDDIVAIMDAPMPSSSYVSQYFVMKLAASAGVKVVLDGQGSDEILGGYMHSMYRVVADMLRRGRLGTAVSELRAHAARQGYSLRKQLDVTAKSVVTMLQDEPSLYRLEFERTAPWLAHVPARNIPLRVESPAGSKFNGFLYDLIRVTLLPTLLHTEDINSMAFSIESRVPFLDHRLVDACFRMPTEHRSSRGETKRVLRAAMRGVVPDAVLDRKDKTGFVTPGHVVWLRGALSFLLDGNWREVDGIVDVARVQTLVDEYRRGDNRQALFLWRLAMMRRWLALRS
ncbi:MAG TPA: asparagine synthase (glutamine-hydrolyzing) [Bacteroidetes bacterium]|nr:asparagine synthase (glutamine-hydrolyzing) [Bacteroidota bacterium]HRK03558.1 asparagine synthase (glutamine-hydrolyzing) [Chlorobiota bacterium]